MAILTLPISQDYVPNWSVWHGLREFLQNTIDADTLGYPMDIRYSPAKKQVTLRNEGGQLDRDALILGYSTKRGDNRQIGQFGEGFKLAMLCLLRQGASITIHTGTEIWTPCIGRSEEFKTDLLQVKTRKVTPTHAIEVRIVGVTEADWESLQDRVLHIRPPKSDEFISVNGGRVLTAGRFHKQLYCKGIYVCQLPGEYTFGYDLKDVKLDRDRGLADPWSLRYEIKRMLMDSVKANNLDPEELLTVLNQDCAESDLFAEQYLSHDLEAAKRVAKVFIEKYGDKAAPVASIGESQKAEEAGLNGVVVGKGAKCLLEVTMGELDVRHQKHLKDTSKVYSLSELALNERHNLMWAAQMTHYAFDPFSLHQVNVVDFVGEGVRGTRSTSGDVRISRAVLGDRAELLGVLVHEASHQGAMDHGLSHTSMIQQALSRIVVWIEDGKPEGGPKDGNDILH